MLIVTLRASSGIVQPQAYKEPIWDSLDRGNACVFPTQQEIQTIRDFIGDLHLVSIGCGEGWVEGLLQQSGVKHVTCVDLVMNPPLRAPSYCGEIARITQYEIYDIDDPPPRQRVLLFCFGRRVPLEAYLEAYPDLNAVIIIGDDTHQVAEPGPMAMEGQHGWVLSLRLPVRGRCSCLCVGYRRRTSELSKCCGDEIGMTQAEIDAL